MIWHCAFVFIHFILVLRLSGALGKPLGTPGDALGATWSPSEHLGVATGQVKRTDDET